MTRKFDVDTVVDFPYSRALFNALSAGVVIHGPDGTVLAANPAAESILGMPQAEMTGLRPGDSRWCCVREDGSVIASTQELPSSRVLATGLPVRDVVMGLVNQTDGRRIWLNISATPIRFELSRVESAVCVVFSDITRVHQQGERLALWGRAFECAELGLVLGDFQSGRLVGANPRFAHERGEQPEALLGRTFLSLFPAELAAAAADCYGQLTSSGHLLFTSENLRADGSRFPVSVDITTVRGVDGWPVQWIAYVLDLSEQRRLQASLEDTGSRYRALVDQAAPDAIFIHDHDGRFREVNARACESLGYSKTELLQMSLADLESDFDLAAARAIWLRIEAKAVATMEGHHRRRDGSVFAVEVRFGLLQETPERLYIGTVRDISERERTSEFLRLANHVYSAAGEAILITDGVGQAVDVNPAFVRVTGYERAEVIGSKAYFERSFGGAHWIGQEFRRSIDSGDRWHGELWDRRKGGQAYAMAVAVRALRDPGGRIFRYVVQFSDISERRLREGLLRRQHDADVLTGLPGRMSFTEQLQDEVQRAAAKGRPLALLCLDLDHFKDINESLGVAKGDQILREFAKRLRGGVREGDLVARLGSDEFAIVMRDFGSTQIVERVAQGLLQAMAAPLQLVGENIEVGASVGAALFPGDAAEVELLMQCADQAMHTAKARGRSRFAWFSESRQRITRDRLLLITDLRHAVMHQELELHYQPIIDLVSGRVVKAEALLRWHHPVRGLIMPGQFIPLIEERKEKELVAEIGEWVGGAAVAMAARLRQRFGRIIQIGVNQSGAQFADGTPALSWPHLLRDHGLPGEAVAVEVTEGVLMQMGSDEVVGERLALLEAMGLELAIDDFGTGFSNFAFLINAHVDYVKIDRLQFTASLLQDPKCQAVVEAIIAMARKLGIRTIAEGIETRAQWDWLRQAGCELGQGYLFSRALDADAFEAYVAAEADV